MLRTLLLTSALLTFAGCDSPGAPVQAGQPAPDAAAVECEPCADDTLTPLERSQRALAEEDYLNAARSFGQYRDMFGPSNFFCEGLPELTRKAVREQMQQNDIEITPAGGMKLLILCQAYFQETDLATLNAYRLDTLLDIEAELGQTEESLRIDREFVARFLRENTNAASLEQTLGVMMSRELGLDDDKVRRYLNDNVYRGALVSRLKGEELQWTRTDGE